MENKKFNLKQFVIITLITSIWIHIGEIARAVLVAFPRMEAFFGDRISKRYHLKKIWKSPTHMKQGIKCD